MAVNHIAPPAGIRPRTGADATPIRVLLAMAALLITVSGCGGSSGAAASAAASAAQTVDSEVEAAEAVGQQNRLLAGVRPLESDSVGQANYWDADSTTDGYRVRYSIGWGDCLAGCIENHELTYVVTRDGQVRLVDESGDAIPPDVLAKLEQGAENGTARQGVSGRVVAGPVCPVEQPNDPACDPRPVPGAVIVVRSADGSEVMRIQADESGLFVVELPAGEYLLEPQEVQGYLGVPEPLKVVVEEGSATEIELEYDTGIR